MKHLGMTLEEIKSTPRYQLDGLLIANGLYENIHSFDGYNSSDINQMAKDKPEIRSAYAKSLQLKAKYERLAGIRENKKIKSFTNLLSKGE